MRPVPGSRKPELTEVELWMQLSFQPGASMKRAAAAIHKLASGNELKAHLTWSARTQFEHEVASLQRFLVDASVSGGDPPQALLRAAWHWLLYPPLLTHPASVPLMEL